MSCLGKCYNPNPPRAWSRVQFPCTYSTNIEAHLEKQMLEKGNVLQYKKNSSNLTKKQVYSMIANGNKWKSRGKTYATQTDMYTNPNILSLERTNVVVFPYPNILTGMPNNPGGPFQTNVPNPFGCLTNDLVDGGSLVCNSTTSPCSGQNINKTTSQMCYPTYCSDVPGKIEYLCWNDGTQTWYPRQMLTMTNSANKFPEGYKGFVSADQCT